MPGNSGFDEIRDVTEDISAITKSVVSIRNQLRTIVNWFRGEPQLDAIGDDANDNKRPGILIIGPGGTGKSTLASDDNSVEIAVPPGQHLRRKGTWEDVLTELSSGAFRGIIVVSAFGFHNIGQISYKNHRLYKSEYKNSKEKFLGPFLEAMRLDEVTVLRRIAPHIIQSKSRLWLLSIVTKQDLWWPDREVVEKHYFGGPYSEEINRILESRDAQDFRNETAFVSLHINNFRTARDELLKRHSADYDNPMQFKSLQQLFARIDSLREWEKSK